MYLNISGCFRDSPINQFIFDTSDSLLNSLLVPTYYHGWLASLSPLERLWILQQLNPHHRVKFIYNNTPPIL